MTAAKHTDPIVGLDMHLIQPPPPAPPLMVPIPVAGIALDPADYQDGACTVYVNGLPRVRAGNVCMMIPPHVPIGGAFVVPPKSEAELYQGSSTVLMDGEAASGQGHQVLGCHDIGSPAPARAWKSGGATSLMKAGSVILPIPGGAIVNVGGSPTTGATSDAQAAPASEWLDVEILDDQDNPQSGIPYEVTFSDGSKRRGRVGDNGRISYFRVPAGEFTLQLFP